MNCNVCFLETNMTETREEFKTEKKRSVMPLDMNGFFFNQQSTKEKFFHTEGKKLL